MSPEEQEIETLINRFFTALDKQDLETMVEITAHDPQMVHIGTESGEYWVGWDQLKRDTIEMFESLESYDAEISDMSVHTGPSGDAAWFAFMLDAEITSAGKTSRIKNGRFTGAAEMRNGSWLLAQTHLSIPEDQPG